MFPKILYRHRVLVFLFFLTFITYLDRICISLVGVKIKSEFHLTNSQFGWVLASFSLAYALFEIPSGVLGDRIGQKAVLIRIVLWWSVCTILTGLTTGFVSLLIVRFLFGVGESGAYPNSGGVVARWFPASETSRGISWFAIGSNIGAAVAPFIILPVAAAYGWRTTFLINGLIGMVWVAICAFWFKNHPSEMKGISEEEKKYIESKGIIFISTPFSRAAANRLHKWDVAAYKIGSGECNNYPLIEHIASFGKPVILSTGMNTIESVSKAVNIFRNYHIPFALLHTTNLYPTPHHLVRLHAMVELQNAFPDAVIGLSDHTVTNHACFGAVALGASILERHFTDHKQRSGPDIACSMDTEDCRELIEGSRIIALQRGGSKAPAAEEQVTIDFAFASICTIQPVKKGEILTKENIWVKRPGKGGIPAEQYDQLLGKIASRDIEADMQLQWDHFEM